MCTSTAVRIFASSVAIHFCLLQTPNLLAEHRCRYATCAPIVSCCVGATFQTVLRAGSEADDLQVHVVGPRFNTIESYFRQEYYREVLPQDNLHCDRVFLAPKNDLHKDYGTFEISLGANKDSLKLYGWEQGKFQPTRSQVLVLENGCCLSISWITPRILKASWGDGKSIVVRFSDDSGWKVLHSDSSNYKTDQNVNEGAK